MTTLQIVTLNGEQFNIVVESLALTVVELKALVARAAKRSEKQVVLLCGGVHMEETETLQQYSACLAEERQLQLIWKLKSIKGTIAENRLIKELKDMEDNPICGMNVRAANKDQWDGTSAEWEVDISGPVGTPWEGGQFLLSVSFPNTAYPLYCPSLHFNTPIFHPAVSTQGGVHMRELKIQFDPLLNVSKLLLKLRSLLENVGLCDSEWENGNKEAVMLLSKDRNAFDQVAAQWTRDYAKPNDFTSGL